MPSAFGRPLADLKEPKILGPKQSSAPQLRESFLGDPCLASGYRQFELADERRSGADRRGALRRALRPDRSHQANRCPALFELVVTDRAKSNRLPVAELVDRGLNGIRQVQASANPIPTPIGRADEANDLGLRTPESGVVAAKHEPLDYSVVHASR